jgi:hypothetical protein
LLLKRIIVLLWKLDNFQFYQFRRMLDVYVKRLYDLRDVSDRTAQLGYLLPRIYTDLLSYIRREEERTKNPNHFITETKKKK